MIKRVAMLAGAAVLMAAAPAKIDMAARLLPPPTPPGKAVAPYVKVMPGKVALVHVRVIDGTGTPSVADRTVLIDGATIVAVQASGDAVPTGYMVIDGTGKSVMPGIIGMHDHQYYIAQPNRGAAGGAEPPLLVPQMTFSSPRLYLARGVTTLRTTGSVEPYTDLNMKASIERGELPGPHMDVTGPYLEGSSSPFIQMHPLKDAADAARTVNFWADQGITSFKAYMNISRAELKAAINAAHARGIKVTGHLCAVTYPEAAMLGIDNLEHGFFVNTQLDPGKAEDKCPDSGGDPTIARMTPETVEGKALIATLGAHHVAITSTLPVFEDASPTYRALPARQLELLTTAAQLDYFGTRLRVARASADRAAENATMWAHALAMERAFVAAGGLLIAGPDPTGGGQVLPGFGDAREIELLVEAGFTPVEAIRIGTLNGATYLGVADHIGSVAPGKRADLVLVDGDPSANIADIEKIVTVFKDGVGYDGDKLLTSVRGHYGQY